MAHYRIIRRLAIGGMAEVFLGKVVGTAGFEKPVAIKRMLPAVAADPKSAEAFLREARLCVHLVHPNVVQVLDLGLTSGQPFLVMELVDGEDLRKVIVAASKIGKPITPPEAIHVVGCVAEALAYAHEATGPDGNQLRVVHRDVNPSNVIVSMRGEVKLADFGVAKAADGRESTQGNLLKGKIGYLAPELLAGQDASHASDIFLAGTLLYELLAGKPLFAGGGSAGRALAAIAAHDETRLELPPGLPPQVLPVLRKALARAPEARHAHAGDLARELQAIVDDLRWRIGRDDLARRMAELFPGRTPLDRHIGEGIPLRDDRDPVRPAAGTEKPKTPVAKIALAAVGEEPAPPPPAPAPRPPAPAGRPLVRRRLGEMLVEAGLLTESQLQTVLARQRLEGGRIGEWVVSLEFAPAKSVLSVLAKQLGVPFVTDEKLLEANPAPGLLARMPQEQALRLLALPMAERDGSVYVAMADPGDLGKLDLLRFHLGPKVRPVVATEFGVRRAIARVYGGREDGLRWRQLDPSDPRAILAGRVIDFDAVERERERPAPPPSFPWNAPGAGGGTPPPGGASFGNPPGFAVPPGYLAGGYPGFPFAAVPNAAGYGMSGGYPVAYVQAGVGPDGQPIFVAVPASPQPVPAGEGAEPPAAVILEPAYGTAEAEADDAALPEAVDVSPLDDDDLAPLQAPPAAAPAWPAVPYAEERPAAPAPIPGPPFDGAVGDKKSR